MEKYYLAKLLSSQSDVFNQQQKVKLVEIHYARRPPSFGVVFLEQQQSSEASTDHRLFLRQQLNLAAYELADNHVAKFHVVRQTILSSAAKGEATLNKGDKAGAPGPLVDFDTNKTILMETSSHHHHHQQQQQQHQLQPQQQQQQQQAHLSSKADSSDQSSKQLPHCVALADDGVLFAIHLIDGQVKRLATEQDKQQHQHQLTRSLLGGSRRSEANFLECKLLNFDEDSMEKYCFIYVLAERSYSIYKLTSGNVREGRLQLYLSYSLQLAARPQFESASKANKIANSVLANRRFVRMLVVESNPHVLVIELSDFSVGVFHDSTCLASLDLSDSLGSPTASLRQHLILTGKSSDEVVLLSYSKTRIVMHSFRINLHSNQQQQQQQSPMKVAGAKLALAPQQRFERHTISNLMDDPDQLLPKEPSFEIEMCWSLDLNDIDSIRSSDDADDEQENGGGGGDDGDDDADNGGGENSDDKVTSGNLATKTSGHINKLLGGHQQASLVGSINFSPGCLCPMWSSNQLITTNCWPKFLLVTYKFHSLVYSFEQQPQLPFSVVYDRSFLKLVPLSETAPATATATMPATLTVASSSKDANAQQEYIDVRMKPKLIHVFKLIGAQPTDSLFNTLFLVSKTSLIKQRHFPQLGLLISLSNAGDVMVFKFTSNKIITQKDGLYQQQIYDSIRCDSLLKDEIERIRVNNNLLREDIENLEMQSSSSKSSNQIVERLDSLLQVELRHCEQVGCLYELKLTLANLVRVSRIFVTLTVSSRIIKPNGLNSAVQSVYIDNNASVCQSSSEQSETTTISNEFHLPGVVLASIGQEELMAHNGDEFGEDDDDEANEDYDYEEHIMRRQHQLDRLNNDNNNNSGVGDTSSAIKAWAMIELVGSDGNNFLLVNKSQFIQLIIPLFMMDGQSGQVQVIFMLGNVNHSETSNSIRSHLTMFAEAQLHQQQHKRFGRNQTENSISKFHSKSIQIKPLLSYKPSSPGQPALSMIKSENKSVSQLSISGSFKRNKMLDWLYECIPDESLDQHQYQSRAKHQSDQTVVVEGKLNSYFTHCFIEYKMGENSVSLKSDDLIALEMIKKHILKRATDESIKLNVDQSSQLNNSTLMNNLRHLIELQQINLDVCSKLQRESDSRHQQLLDRNATDELQLIMESLIGDKNQIDDFPIDLAPSDDDWFEKSLKQDLIELAGKSQAQTLVDKTNDEMIIDSEPFILRDFVCNYICNILDEFDRLQGARHSSEAIRTLRKKLTKSICQYDKASFVDKVLIDWNESKKVPKDPR